MNKLAQIRLLVRKPCFSPPHQVPQAESLIVANSRLKKVWTVGHNSVRTFLSNGVGISVSDILSKLHFNTRINNEFVF